MGSEIDSRLAAFSFERGCERSSRRTPGLLHCRRGAEISANVSPTAALRRHSLSAERAFCDDLIVDRSGRPVAKADRCIQPMVG
jgi:hypothetical protein